MLPGQTLAGTIHSWAQFVAAHSYHNLQAAVADVAVVEYHAAASSSGLPAVPDSPAPQQEQPEAVAVDNVVADNIAVVVVVVVWRSSPGAAAVEQSPPGESLAPCMALDRRESRVVWLSYNTHNSRGASDDISYTGACFSFC